MLAPVPVLAIASCSKRSAETAMDHAQSVKPHPAPYSSAPTLPIAQSDALPSQHLRPLAPCSGAAWLLTFVEPDFKALEAINGSRGLLYNPPSTSITPLFRRKIHRT